MNLNGIEHIYIAQHLVRVVTAHDKFAAIVGAEMLRRWREGGPGWDQFSQKIKSRKTRNTFPSPDISFWDETNQYDIQCEFKPPNDEDKTDTIHTGTGQSFVYLHPDMNADVTFLVVPKSLNDGFNVEAYLKPFFEKIILGCLPIGLILYNPKKPKKIEMACAPDLTLIRRGKNGNPKKWSTPVQVPSDLSLESYRDTESKVAAEMLRRWQEGGPGWNQFSPEIRQSKPRNSFPSPNISFRDETNDFDIQCKFKVMAEKRATISNGIGQSMGYLHPDMNADVTFLVVPKYLEKSGFDVGGFLTAFYEEVIEGILPAGLILYDPEDLSQIEMACAPDLNLVGEKKTAPPEKKSAPKVVEKRARPGFHTVDRYWAKWCDMSTSELHYLLHSSHACKDMDKETRKNEIISSTWEWLIGPPPYLKQRDPHVFWAPTMGETTTWRKKRLLDGTPYPGKPIEKGSKVRNRYLEKIESGRLSKIEAEKQFSEYLNEKGGNSPMYRVIYKNSFMTLDHLQLWDGSYFLTERGMKLYEIGCEQGPNSSSFIDAFASMMLTIGGHYRLITDLHSLTEGKDFKSSDEAIDAFVKYYASKNLIRFNEERKTDGKGGTKPMKNEILNWKKLGLLQRKSENSDKNGWVKGDGFLFNHHRINLLLNTTTLPDVTTRNGESSSSRVLLTLFSVGVIGLLALFSNVFGWDSLPLFSDLIPLIGNLGGSGIWYYLIGLLAGVAVIVSSLLGEVLVD